MATTWLQVLLATSIHRVGNSLLCPLAIGYLRQPGSPCQYSYNQMGVSTPSFISYVVSNNERQLLARADTL